MQETDEKKRRMPPKLESKKRPKTRHYGTLNESTAGLVRMFPGKQWRKTLKALGKIKRLC
jgi:hypothetical protein